MRFRDFIVRRAIQTVITVLIVLVLMFVLFRAMPSNPVDMMMDPKWGPREKHYMAVRYGFERDETTNAIFTGQATQDSSSGNMSHINVDLANSKYNKKIIIPSGTLWFQATLKWGDNKSADLLYLGLFREGRGGGDQTGPEPEELEVTGIKSLNMTIYNDTATHTSYRRQTAGVDRDRSRIYEEDIYYFVVNGRNVSNSAKWEVNVEIIKIVKISMWEQFLVYMKNMLSLDFGRSFYSQRPVTDELAIRIGPTLLLFGTASIIGPIIGIALGVLLAWKRGTRFEIGTIVVALFFYSMPIFWLGMMMLWGFASQVPIFPRGGMVDVAQNYQGLAYVGDLLYHMALPLITMMMAGLAGGILLMRNSLLEVIGEDYVTTAKAKGLTERRVMYKHAARNAMLPVVTSIAMGVGGAVSGGVLTETIFNWPGVGRYLVSSTLQQDYPVVQATFFILAMITILANIAADVMYAYLDPRVRI